MKRSVYAGRLQFAPTALNAGTEHTARKLFKWGEATAKRLRVDMREMYALHGAGFVVCEKVETPLRDLTKWRLTTKARNWIEKSMPVEETSVVPAPAPADDASISDVAKIMRMRARLDDGITVDEDRALGRLIARWAEEGE